MPNFRYRAITQNGELVNGSLSAPTAAEVARRIEYLGLVPIETVADDGAASVSRATLALFNQPRAEDVTVFTRDLGLLLKAGARLDDALELLASDTDIGRLHPVVSQIRAAILAGVCVLTFFILFVLPQFSSVLRDFGAKGDSAITTFLNFSDFLRGNATELTIAAVAFIVGMWILLRRKSVRTAIISEISRLPGISTIFNFYRAALFCRNLGILLSSDVTLTATLRILVDIMAVTGRAAPWMATADRVRHGGKLSDALAAAAILPPMAIRMLRIGEETGQMPTLSARVAEFYEAKLQRSLDRVVGVVGPLAIISISIVVGGLIVSVMTALLSITQVVG